MKTEEICDIFCLTPTKETRAARVWCTMYLIYMELSIKMLFIENCKENGDNLMPQLRYPIVSNVAFTFYNKNFASIYPYYRHHPSLSSRCVQLLHCEESTIQWRNDRHSIAQITWNSKWCEHNLQLNEWLSILLICCCHRRIFWLTISDTDKHVKTSQETSVCCDRWALGKQDRTKNWRAEKSGRI